MKPNSKSARSALILLSTLSICGKGNYSLPFSSIKRRFRNNALGYGKTVAAVKQERLDRKNERRAANGLKPLKSYSQV